VRCIVALIALLLACGFQNQGPKKDERQELYDWFDTLGFDAIKTCTFVRVDFTDTHDVGEWRRETTYGFLLSGSGDHFSILDVNLQRIDFPDNSKRWGRRDSAHFAPWDLSLFFTTYREGGSLWPYGMATPFVYSRIAAARGYSYLAESLYREATQVSPHEEDQQNASIPNRIKEDLADGLLNFDLDGMEDPAYPREASLRDMRLLEDHFPDFRPTKRAAQYAGELEKMIAENALHGPLTRSQIALLPEDKQVAEWIYQLRDQTGEQFMEPGYCDVLHTLSSGLESDDSPAGALVKLNFRGRPTVARHLARHPAYAGSSTGHA